MSCKLKHIEKLNVPVSEKERLTAIALDIWHDVKDFTINGSKVFRKQGGRLYNTKNFYTEAQNKISAINKKYGAKVIDMSSGRDAAYKEVRVNVVNLVDTKYNADSIKEKIDHSNFNAKLREFFSTFGISYTEGENYVDLLHRTVFIKEDEKNDGHIETSATILTQLLLSSPIIDIEHLSSLIENTSEFKDEIKKDDETYNIYRYLNEGNRIPFDEWVEYIKKYNKVRDRTLKIYFKGSLEKGRDRQSELATYLDKFIKWFKDLFKNTKQLTHVTDGIISQVLLNNKEIILDNRQTKDKELVSIEKAFRETKHGENIINYFGNNGLILTGSIALGEQGTVYRKLGHILHDIDWVIPHNYKESPSELLTKQYPGAQLVREFDSSTYYTKTYIVPPKGYKVINLTFFKPELYGNKYTQSYEVVDKDGKVMSNYYRTLKEKPISKKVIATAEEYNRGIASPDKNISGISVDFFYVKEALKFSPITIKLKSGSSLKISNSLNIFTEKLKYRRLKDLTDWTNFIPNGFEAINTVLEAQGKKGEQTTLFSEARPLETINYSLKASGILQSDKAKQIFTKGVKNNWNLEKILTELQIPKAQKELILEKGLKDNIDPKNKKGAILLNKAPKTTLATTEKETNIFTSSDRVYTRTEQEEESVSLKLVNGIIFNYKTQSTFLVTEIIDNILAKQDISSEYGKVFLQKFRTFKHLQNIKVRVSERVKMNKDNTGIIVGEYETHTNTIVLYRPNLIKVGINTAISTILHELTHAATYNAYKAPSNQTERMFRDDMDAAFAYYNNIAEDTTSYGFSSALEFIAEVFSSKTFREELQRLDALQKGRQGIISKIINAIRRLFNLAIKKDDINYNSVLKDILNIASKSQNIKKTSTEAVTLSKVISKKETDEEHVIRDLSTIEGRLQEKVDKILDVLEAHKRIAVKKRDGSVNMVLQEKVDEVIFKIKEFEETDKIKVLVTFARFVKERLNSLSLALDQRIIDEELTPVVLNQYKVYTASYSLIEDVNILFKESIYDSNEISEKDRTILSTALDNIEGSFTGMQKKFKALEKNLLREFLKNPIFHSKQEHKLLTELGIEFDNIHTGSEGKEEWIAKKLASEEYQEKLKALIDKEVEHILYDRDEDISWTVLQTVSELSLSSKMVSILSTVLTEMRDTIVMGTRDHNFELSALFSQFIKGKNTSNLPKLYENIIEQDSDGNYYLYGEYKPEFLVQLDNKRNAYIVAKEEFGEESEQYTKAYREFVRWVQVNTGMDKYGNTVIKPKWKNKKRNLSEIEKEVLEFFKYQSRQGSVMTFGYNSLVRIYGETEFVKLPAMTKSDLERMISDKDIKGIFVDKYKDITEMRPDDVGYATMPTTINNIPIKTIPVHYRGKIEAKNQSLDLFTMYALDFKNTYSFSIKKKYEVVLNSLVDTADSKSYYQRAGIGNKVLGLFATRTKFAEQDRKQGASNTVKKMQGMLENQLYEEYVKYAGELGGVDINKATQKVISYTTALGLMGNILGAVFNPIMGNTNTFLEGIAGDVFTVKNMRKAFAKYVANLPGSLRDLSKPVKAGFINQLSQMFDIHGEKQVLTQVFLKNNLLKSIVSPDLFTDGYAMGEHEIQSVLLMAVLDSVKVMNGKSEYINKEGKKVAYKQAASMLDMVKLNSDGKIDIDEKVVYTEFSPTVKMKEGGKIQIKQLIMSKIFETQGLYNTMYDVELARTSLGKLFLTFRRFLFEAFVRRFKGMENAVVKWDEMEGKLQWNDARKAEIEGSYISFVRFVSRSIVPAVKQFKFNVITTDWENMSAHQRGNIKRTAMEMALIVMLIYGVMAMKGFADEDDKNKEAYYFFAYMFRRSISEIEQFLNPLEAWKILKSPSASIRTAENLLKAVGYMSNPFLWDDVYQSGKHKGDSKLKQNVFNAIPVVSKLDVSPQESFNWLANQ